MVGAQRERVREILSAAAISCTERDISWGELDVADEVFLTNSLIGVWPVAAMDARRWPAGPVTRRLQQLVAEDDARA